MNYSKQRDNTIIIKEKSKMHQVEIENIIYIECESYLITFYLKGDDIVTCSGIFKNIEETLIIYNFIRISRNTIVNMRYFRSFLNKKRSFELINGKSFQVSRRRWYYFKNCLDC